MKEGQSSVDIDVEKKAAHKYTLSKKYIRKTKE